MNFDTRVYFGMSGQYNQPVQYGRDAAHKSRAACAVIPLGVYMSERQHIYEDLNESSSARPGGSQQLEIPQSPNSKRTPNFSADIFARGGDFNAHQDSIVRIYSYQMPTFCIPAKILGGTYILYIRQHFHETPIFWVSANILGICQYFHETPIFWASANIFMRCQDFGYPPIIS
jgi:hypothetical protein